MVGIAFYAIRNYNNLGMPYMTRQRMRKVTYSLPEDLLDGVRAVVQEGAPADSLGASIGSEDTGFATEMEASLVGIPKTASDAPGTAESEAP